MRRIKKWLTPPAIKRKLKLDASLKKDGERKEEGLAEAGPFVMLP